MSRIFINHLFAIYLIDVFCIICIVLDIPQPVVVSVPSSIIYPFYNVPAADRFFYLSVLLIRLEFYHVNDPKNLCYEPGKHPCHHGK